MFWEDACDILDIECKYVGVTYMGQSHAVNVVKLDGKWYRVDSTGHREIDTDVKSSYFYKNFLDNSAVSFKSNYYGYDLSSDHYSVITNSGYYMHYFDTRETIVEGEHWLTYDSTLNRYALQSIYDEE
jgi:hypothetical protein